MGDQSWGLGRVLEEAGSSVDEDQAVVLSHFVDLP